LAGHKRQIRLVEITADIRQHRRTRRTGSDGTPQAFVAVLKRMGGSAIRKEREVSGERGPPPAEVG
jgi:hypothetical protein